MSKLLEAKKSLFKNNKDLSLILLNDKLLNSLTNLEQLKKYIKIHCSKTKEYPFVHISGENIYGTFNIQDFNGNSKDILKIKHPIFVILEKEFNNSSNEIFRPSIVTKDFFKTYEEKRIPYRYDAIITPAKALHILITCNCLNRNVHWQRVINYKECILNNDWHQTDQGISFYHNGTFSNGQNRLLSVILSGKPISQLLSFGLTIESGLYVDEGKRRTLKDATKIQGKNFSPIEISVGNWMLRTLTKSIKIDVGINNAGVIDYLEKYMENIQFATSSPSNYSGPSLRNIQVIAAIAKCHAHITTQDNKYTDQSLKQLEQFRNIIITNTYNNKQKDSGAIKVINLLKQKKQFAKKKLKLYSYYRIEYCIDMFLQNKLVEKLPSGKKSKEIFMLLEDIQQIKRTNKNVE